MTPTPIPHAAPVAARKDEMMTASLIDLQKRLTAATGPDREIEIDLWRMFIRPDAPAGKAPLPWSCCFTESIDAAKLLVEHMGGRLYTVDASIVGQCRAMVQMPPRRRPSEIDGEPLMLNDYGGAVHAHLSIAIVAALMDAMVQRNAQQDLAATLGIEP